MLLTAKTKDEYKKELYEKQGGICPLCKRELNSNIEKNHLDHDHALDGKNAGRCRSLLCLHCNPLEGEIMHAFYHSGLHTAGIDFEDWISRLVDYIKRDYSQNKLFPSYPNDKYKAFKRLTRPEMIAIMESENFEYDEKDTREVIAKKYKKQFVKRLKE